MRRNRYLAVNAGLFRVEPLFPRLASASAAIGAKINTDPIPRRNKTSEMFCVQCVRDAGFRPHCFHLSVFRDKICCIRLESSGFFYIFVRNLTKLRLMAKIKGTVVVDKERCKGCGVCVASCPCNVLGMSAEVNSKGYPVARMANPDACIGCASCAVICPDSVITAYRQKIE